MSTRTSSRQAAAKANEAMHEATGRAGTRNASAGGKRKASVREEAKARPQKVKRGKEENEKKRPEQPKVEDEEEAKRGEEGKLVNGGENGETLATGMKKGEDEGKPNLGDQAKGKAVEESEQREEIMPSNILEKGVIYFFFRPRVSVEDPEGLQDVARSFVVLRPLPHDAKLGQGPLEDAENCRLLLLPKKKLPTTPHERYMSFVEKAGVSTKTLRESFEGEEHETKTRGIQHVPPTRPLAEGVYAITSTTRTSHLAYILTIPSELDEVQKDFGLRNRGSFVMSVKNPQFSGPPVAQLPKGPEYPQKVLAELRDLRFAPLRPEFINYPNAQVLMIGEGQEEFRKSGETEGKKPGEETAGEEVETLEHENEVRAYPLRGDDTVFDDLGMSIKDFPKVPTTWE